MKESPLPRTGGRVLVVESDPVLGKSVSDALQRNHYDPVWYRSGREAVQASADGAFDVAIIDLNLEGDIGLDVVLGVREQSESMGVILITPVEASRERRDALAAGADDFLIKPLSIRELIIRLEMLEIRAAKRPQSIVEAGPLRVDFDRRKAYHDGELLALTPTEFRILEILVRYRDRVVTRRLLCEFLWSPEWEGMTNVIEVHMNRLRNKIGRQEARELICTVRGQGYVLRTRPPSSNGHSESRLTRVGTHGSS
ncbi:MAG: DNA-binding response regulator [Planctomycetota bacterium]|nr:MAG: DNA-binding response regulator [Planctomycetota bacterium]